MQFNYESHVLLMHNLSKELKKEFNSSNYLDLLKESCGTHHDMIHNDWILDFHPPRVGYFNVFHSYILFISMEPFWGFLLHREDTDTLYRMLMRDWVAVSNTVVVSLKRRWAPSNSHKITGSHWTLTDSWRAAKFTAFSRDSCCNEKRRSSTELVITHG